MIDRLTRKAALTIPAVRRLKEQRDATLQRLAELERRVAGLAAGHAGASEANATEGKHLSDVESRFAALAAATERTASTQEQLAGLATERALAAVRAEYTALPRFAYHLPMDYEAETMPPAFDPPVLVEGETLPLPPPAERHGHTATDAEYLEWGRYEKELLLGFMRERLPSLDGISIMDFGCSSGRILRHFHADAAKANWKLTGVDVSARRVEWMRRHFPRDIQVYTGTFLPILPFESNSIDVIYGMSVFTHIKYLWDTWLLELRRVLKPGGLLIQSIHTEHAWRFFAAHKHEAWARDALGPMIVEHAEMPADYVYFGDLDKNQVFWKRDIAIEFWSRYYRDVEVLPPPERYSYQNWIIARK